MASNLELVEFIADQLRDAGEITYRKMFGEYGIYLDGKYFACISDDQLFIKITNAGKSLCPNLTEAPPYDGAKNCFLVEDIENREMLVKLATATCEELPKPKKRK